MSNAAIAWPAVLHFNGDHELTFIASQADWDAHAELHTTYYVPNDRLIDSRGNIFRLNLCASHGLVAQQSSRTASLTEVVELLKAHMSQQGACCVSNFFAASIGEAIAIAFPDSS